MELSFGISERGEDVEIGGKHYKDIIVTDSEGGVIAVVTDDEIIEYEGYRVILEPTK